MIATIQGTVIIKLRNLIDFILIIFHNKTLEK